MIDEVLTALVCELNSALRESFLAGEDLLMLSPPCEPDGTPVQRVEDRLALFVACVSDRSPAPLPMTPVRPMTPMPSTRLLELSVVCAACHGSANYGEGLKLLEAVTAWLATRPLLTRQNCPRLPVVVDQVEIVAESLSLADWQALWRMHGGRYLPAMMYRVRLETPAWHGLARIVPTLEELD